MKNNLLFAILFAVLLLASGISRAQSISSIEPKTDSGGIYPSGKADALNPCVTPEQYRSIEQEIATNLKRIHGNSQQSTAPNSATTTTTFIWPLRTANGLNDCSYYAIFNYIDEDTTSGGIKDYNCGSATYDGHAGTDIGITPFLFYKMDLNQVEIIAAAAGTIVAKADGNYDKNCAANNLSPNYIVIQHADGSCSVYLHMKKNSLTSKAIGATVALGEFLGNVGSSGSSTGPHLHFEVWNGTTFATRTDPWQGTCNRLSARSWWVSQRSYREPALMKAGVHSAVPLLPACPATEIPYEDSCYQPGVSAVLAIYLRNETDGLSAACKILNPDGTTFSNWVHNSTGDYVSTWWYWHKTMPTIPGTYTFEATYNGTICSKHFDVIGASITAPTSTTICYGDSVTLIANAASSYLWSTGATTRAITVSKAGNYSVTVKFPAGCSATSPITVVTTSPAPAATIIPNKSTTICDGDSVTLTVSAASTYLWNTGAASQSINVFKAGKYSVTVANAAGCTATSAETNVVVNPLPIAKITPSGSTNICQGEGVMLTSDSASNYLWSNSAKSRSISVSEEGSYWVVVTDANGCSAASAETKVTVQTLPMAVVTQQGIVLTAQTVGATYQWLDCGNHFSPIKGATNQIYIASTDGLYSVAVTVNGCSDTSTCYTVSTVGVSSIPSQFGVHIYPNPTTGKLWIDSKSQTISDLKIYNVLGKNIFSYDPLHPTSEIDLSEQPAGLYYVIMNSAGVSEVIKIVLTK
jgi:murein DD-endopeptidase MepM/ murein hydrolase activator NlpD